jgi:hypothetical protein
MFLQLGHFGRMGDFCRIFGLDSAEKGLMSGPFGPKMCQVSGSLLA